MNTAKHAILVIALAGAGLGCAPERHREPRLALLCPTGMAGLLTPLTDAWSATRGMRVQLAEESPERITRQVNGGAPGDLYLSAEPRWLAELTHDEHVLAGESWPLFDDPLVIATRAQPERPVRLPMDLARPHPLHVALPSRGWAARAGRLALQQTGLWTSLREQSLPVDDGPAAIAALVSGKADAAILRRSEAVSASTALTITDWPRGECTSARVELAMLRTAPHRTEALDLAHYLTEDPAVRLGLQAAGLNLLGAPLP